MKKLPSKSPQQTALKLALGAVLLGVLGTLGIWALSNGWIRLNYPSPKRFQSWGIDVSHHQGAIDWEQVARAPHIQFAYIKATEGSDFKDSRFKENWQAAQQAGLKVGAYHFFSFCSDGQRQATHFLSVLQPLMQPGAATLPPVVDVEWGGNCKKEIAPAIIRNHLKNWLQIVEQKLNRKAVIYVTPEAYQSLIQGDTWTQSFWLRNIFKEPQEFPSLLFWQFANRGHVPGIYGFVDLNVYFLQQPFENMLQ